MGTNSSKQEFWNNIGCHNTNTSLMNTSSTMPFGVKSWSNVTMGRKPQGGFLNQESPFFQEEFPSLSSGSAENSQQEKKKEEGEQQYGPGPSLRPQNVASWRH